MGELEQGPLGDAEAANLQLLRAYIAANDVACPVCGYNLRGLTADICPECGQQFHLRVGSSAVRFGMFLIFVAPMLMVVGLALLMFGIVLVDGPRGGLPGGVFAIWVAGLGDAIAAFGFYAERFWFLRKSGDSRAVAIAISWLAHVSLVIAICKLGF